MKKKFLQIGLLWLLCINYAMCQVTGTALILGQTDNSGVKVKFIAKSPTATSDSTITSSNGSFLKNITPGLYQITFSKNGYQTVFNKNGTGQNILLTNTSKLDTTYILSGKYLFTKGAKKGKLSKDTVYIFTDNLIVNQGDTLNIEPGTVISLYPNSKIIIDGKFIAKGLSNDSIQFMSYENLFNQNSSVQWAGFNCNNGMDTLVLEYCNINSMNSEKDIPSLLGNPIFRGNTVVRNTSFLNSPYVYANISNGAYVEFSNSMFNNCNVIGSEGSGFLKFNCNKVTFIKYIENSSPPNYPNLILNSDVNKIENNYFDFNGYLRGNIEGWLIDKNSFRTEITFKNNILTNFRTLWIQLNESSNNNPGTNFEFNSLIGEVLRFDGYSKNPTLYSANVKNNIFNLKLNNPLLDESFFSNSFTNNNVFYGNFNFIRFPNPTGFGNKIVNNLNGDSVDTYNNLFEDPMLQIDSLSILAKNSPAIKSGLDDSGKVVNIGYDPKGTCLEYLFKKANLSNPGGPISTTPGNLPTSDTLSISGTVHQGTGLLADGIVMAIEKSTNKSKILRVTNGNFKLDSLAKGNYILYAIPNPVTVTNYLPTFYVNKVKLKDAVTLSLQGHIRSVDIYLAALNTSVTGTYTITGRFSYEDGNSRDSSDFKTNWFGQTNAPTTPIAVTTNTCNTMPVLLYNSQNSLLQSTVTDTSGYFTFKNIPADTYKVLGQRNTYTSKNEGLVVLGTSPNEIVRLSMESVVTDFEEELSTSSAQILTYPNPFNQEIQTKGFAGEMTVVDVTGKLVLQTTLQENETISTTSWPAGFYILKAGNTLQKLIKQE